ncbi:MAG TPA: NUDIX domain-containing protein [Hanamia sp.]|nr:NUDIX domain-containing protein [Hanamia sp.]
MYDKDFIKLKAAFFKHFTLIRAAGGLVKNKEGEILLIFRLGKWDLPKGKLEENETLEECAIREVQEKTGLRKLELNNLIKISYHIYTQFGKRILKETHWYAMNATEDEKLIPQAEEDITKIVWSKKGDLEKYFLNSYPTIVEILKNEN